MLSLRHNGLLPSEWNCGVDTPVMLSRYYDSSPCRWRAAEGSFCLLRPAPAVCVRKKSNEWRAESRAGGCLVPDVIGIDSNWSLSNSTQIKIDTSLFLKTLAERLYLALSICKDILIIKVKEYVMPSLYGSAASGGCDVLWSGLRTVDISGNRAITLNNSQISPTPSSTWGQK